MIIKNTFTHLPCFFLLFITFSTHAQIITTFAGSGDSSGYNGDGGQADAARLSRPNGIAIDRNGNKYISDQSGAVIRKIDTSGIITTIAGIALAGLGCSGDYGPADSAQIAATGIAVDDSGNIYLADYYDHRVRKINTAGIIITIAGNGTAGNSGDGGLVTAAELNTPMGVAIDQDHNIYIADNYANCIRKVDSSGIITTIAGPAATILTNPTCVFADSLGNVYIGQRISCVRKIDKSGIITTIADRGSVFGNSGAGGSADSAVIGSSYGIAADGTGNIYFSDLQNSCIHIVNTSGIINTYTGNDTAGYSGDDGLAIKAELHGALGIALDNEGYLYIADSYNNRIRRVSPATTGINLLSAAQKIKIYPNPSSGFFNISMPATTEASTITVTDIYGRVVTDKVAPPNTSNIEINIRIHPGNYLVKVQNINSSVVQQIVVE